MYPFERYYKELETFVQNLEKPEGSIVQGYKVEEALDFITEDMAQYRPTSRCVWDDKEDPTMADEILEGKGRPRLQSDELKKWLHGFVCEMLQCVSHIASEWLLTFHSLSSKVTVHVVCYRVMTVVALYRLVERHSMLANEVLYSVGIDNNFGMYNGARVMQHIMKTGPGLECSFGGRILTVKGIVPYHIHSS